jgi:hypothetical protein
MQPACWRRIRIPNIISPLVLALRFPLGGSLSPTTLTIRLRKPDHARRSGHLHQIRRFSLREDGGDPWQKNFQSVDSLSNDVSNCIDEMPWYLDRSPLTSMTFIPRRLTITVLPTAIPCESGNSASVLLEVEKIVFLHGRWR